MYKIHNGLAPQYTLNMFQPVDHSYNLREKNTLLLPSYNTRTYRYQNFRYTGEKLWNDLGPEMKYIN